MSWGSARAYRGVWKAALTAEGDQAFPGKGNLPAVEEELRRLRAENQKLRMERELKKPDRPGFWGGAPMWE